MFFHLFDGTNATCVSARIFTTFNKPFTVYTIHQYLGHEYSLCSVIIYVVLDSINIGFDSLNRLQFLVLAINMTLLFSVLLLSSYV